MTLRSLSFVAVPLVLFALGCSDAPARPAKLGLSVMVKNPDQTGMGVGRSCPTMTGVQFDIGKAIRSGGMVTGVDSPTASDFGTTLEDGQSGTHIACTVRKSGQVTSDGGGTDPQITRPNGLINFTFSGTAKKGSTTGTASMSVYTQQTGSIRWNTGFPKCAVTAVHEQDAGALWADFDCPLLTEPTNPGLGCHASGTIVLEYCKTGEEE